MATQRMTVTEALARIKLIDSKVESKQKFVRQYAARPEVTVDPLESEGGSRSRVQAELQAISDLLDQRLRIRTEIARVNAECLLDIQDVPMTVAEWLVWRREIYQRERQIPAQLLVQLKNYRQQVQGWTKENPEADVRLVLNVDEDELHRRIEKLDEIYNELDGRLTLHNSTVFVEI